MRESERAAYLDLNAAAVSSVILMLPLTMVHSWLRKLVRIGSVLFRTGSNPCQPEHSVPLGHKLMQRTQRLPSAMKPSLH